MRRCRRDRRGRRPGATAAGLALGGVLLLGAPVGAGVLEDELRARWVGRWVVVRAEVVSGCDDSYTNNRAIGSAYRADGHHRLPSGEIGRVDNLHVHRARVDLLLGLGEPVRHAFRDGPFELYEHLPCRVELELPVPRRVIKQRDAASVEALLLTRVERHGDPEAATASALWNGRAAEPLPDDYEETLVAYTAWKEEQLFHALRVRLSETLLEAGDLLRASAGESAHYAQGMLLGAEDFHDEQSFQRTDCASLPDAGFRPKRTPAPKELDAGATKDWASGFDDGQLLAFSIELARRLELCLR